MGICCSCCPDSNKLPLLVPSWKIMNLQEGIECSLLHHASAVSVRTLALSQLQCVSVDLMILVSAQSVIKSAS